MIKLRAAQTISNICPSRLLPVLLDRSRGNPHEKVTADQLAAAAAKPYETLRQSHVADYQKLFGRASLDLGGHEARSLPTDQRVARMANRAHLLKNRADLVTWYLIIRRSALFQAEKAGTHSPIFEHRITAPLTY